MVSCSDYIKEQTFLFSKSHHKTEAKVISVVMHLDMQASKRIQFIFLKKILKSCDIVVVRK